MSDLTVDFVCFEVKNILENDLPGKSAIMLSLFPDSTEMAKLNEVNARRTVKETPKKVKMLQKNN